MKTQIRLSTAKASTSTVRVLLSSAPRAEAEGLARVLVEERLAACVNLVAGVRSIYRWREKVQSDDETLLIIKTTAELVGMVKERVGELHSYEVPELLAFEPSDGLDAYLDWVVGAVKSPTRER